MTETIYFNSPVGKLKLSCNDDAVESLLFVKEEIEQEISSKCEDLANRKTALAITAKCLQELDDYFNGKLFNFSVKLNQQGTDFQQSVWNALTAIKPGTTKSYMQLSKSLGNAKAIRAVGTANGKNAIVIMVPCHRVIGSNGSLVGYGGGLWRKKWLLEHEAKYLSGMQLLF
ncbi:MAG: methylated-DNA--[protein]-cysteine S-methyltransferase [Ferruginibacter sp.]